MVKIKEQNIKITVFTLSFWCSNYENAHKDNSLNILSLTSSVLRNVGGREWLAMPII